MKKVAISGKGGVGKSLLTTLLATVLTEKGYTVLTVDSDESNPGLYRMLGFESAPRPLIELFGGERQVLAEARRRTMPDLPQPQAAWLRRERISLEDIPDEYILQKGRLKLLTAGKITNAFEGCACPLAEVIKVFLGKLTLKDNEVSLADMEAGVEHFGRGVEKDMDTVLVVVEPSFEAVALAAKVNFLARGTGIKDIWAVLNKVPSPEIEERLQGELTKRGINCIGSIHYDPQVATASLEGKPLQECAAKEDVRGIAERLLRPK